MLRYLFGPIDRKFARDRLAWPRATAACLAFDARGETDIRLAPDDSWAAAASQFPAGWTPDFIALWPAYGIVPAAIWDAPVPVVVLAADWNLLWHQYCRLTPSAELTLTDAAGVEAFTATGHVAEHALLHGCGLDDLSPAPEVRRDIDLLFVGNLNSAVQSERAPWVGRVAALADRYRVEVRTNVFGAEYRALLRRARIVFNRSIRGECNQRVFEAAAAGALLLQEAGNREVPAMFVDRQEYVAYRDDDLEALVAHYLACEPVRAAIAAAARAKVADYRFDRLWEQAVSQLDLAGLQARRSRRAGPPVQALRGCELLGVNPTRWASPILTAPLRAAAENGDQVSAYLLGLISPAAAAVTVFARVAATEPEWVVAGLGLSEALAAAGRTEEAVVAARAALGRLANGGIGWDRPAASYPPIFDSFRVEWERAGWRHAGDLGAAAQAKASLLRWRLHDRLAHWTDDIREAEAAAAARPDLPAAQAALGAALARNGRPTEALPHLRAAVAADPLNRVVAAQLVPLLDRVDDRAGAASTRAQPGLDRRVAPTFVAPPRQPRRLVWEGGAYSLHSYAQVNRELCLRLIARGHEVSLRPVDGTGDKASLELPGPLADRVGAALRGPAELWVRHRWPPQLSRPPEGRFVLIQPWEYGSLPRDWASAARDQAAEVWAYSQAVRDCYLAAGVPRERVHIVPLGVDITRFRPDAPPIPLSTRKNFKFLFVGGTIRRKGFDLLLAAYAEAFTATDDVCLVIKDHGVSSFYRGQTGSERVAELQARRNAPEILYLPGGIPATDLPGLYVACDCLVLPFRGEGFGLPVAEAMACGRPVVVTAASPATDYCDSSTAYLVPATRRELTTNWIGDLETVARPWLHEPSLAALADALRAAVAGPAGGRIKGRAAADRIRSGWTWEAAVRAIEGRMDQLLG